jgi:histidinol-phosphate aminotransferase
MIDYSTLVRSQIGQLPVYQPGRPTELLARERGLDPACILKLASNENPLGACPAAVEAAQRALTGSAALYPDNSGYRLVSALCDKYGWQPEQLTLAAGSNEIFYLLCDLLVEPGVEVVFGAQAFISYRIATQLAGGTPVAVPMPDYCHDLAAMRAAITPRTRLVFLPNPNNPTGSRLPAAHVAKFVADLPRHVVFCYDEAYREYDDDPLDIDALLADGHPVIATRTFSKIYGLAGLRIGYGVSDRRLAALLNAVRPPFNTSVVAQAAACAALADDGWVATSRGINTAGLRQLEKGFSELGLEWVPSAGNFILVRVPKAPMVFDALQNSGIIVRPVTGYDLPSHLRISVGTEPQNARLLAAMATIIQQQGAVQGS